MFPNGMDRQPLSRDLEMPMKKLAYFESSSPGAVLLVLGVLCLLLACTSLPHAAISLSASNPQEPNSDAARADFITTARPSRRDFPVGVPWMGKVESQQKVRLIALEAGRVASISVADGDSVIQGSEIIRLAGPMVQSRLSAMQTHLAAIRERLELAQQRVTHKRQAVAEKVAAIDELLQAQDALVQRQADLTAALEAQKAFTVRLSLRAPISGVFTQCQVSIGQDVDPGTILATVLDPTHLRIEATVFLTETAPLRGRTAMVVLDSKASLTGTVTHVLPDRTPTGGTRVWITGEAMHQALRPGQGVRGTLRLATHTAALAVPRSALVYDEQEIPYVFIKQEQRYTQQQVQTGLTANGWVEILTGLEPRDDVVTQGAYELFYRTFSHTFKVAD
jgi:RND family efflux transporter MFP subunit